MPSCHVVVVTHYPQQCVKGVFFRLALLQSALTNNVFQVSQQSVRVCTKRTLNPRGGISTSVLHFVCAAMQSTTMFRATCHSHVLLACRSRRTQLHFHSQLVSRIVCVQLDVSSLPDCAVRSCISRSTHANFSFLQHCVCHFAFLFSHV